MGQRAGSPKQSDTAYANARVQVQTSWQVGSMPPAFDNVAKRVGGKQGVQT